MSTPEWVPEWPPFNVVGEALTPGARLALCLAVAGVALAAALWSGRATDTSRRVGR